MYQLFGCRPDADTAKSKCIKHVPGKKSALGDRPANRRPHAAEVLDLDRMPLVRGITNIKDFKAQQANVSLPIRRARPSSRNHCRFSSYCTKTGRLVMTTCRWIPRRISLCPTSDIMPGEQAVRTLNCIIDRQVCDFN